VIGEKLVKPSAYVNGDWHDDCGWGDAFDPDVMRYTVYTPVRDNESVNGYEFGSAHPNGINVVFADGSVRSIRFGVGIDIFTRLGHRSDGGVVDLSSL
jgi:prepilin-type processing-associated H-X9-DG protein